MSSYFDFSSWTRARNNREALEKTNPQNPVLNEEDEDFLQRIASQEAPAPPLPDAKPITIADDGTEKEASDAQREAAEMVLPTSPGNDGEAGVQDKATAGEKRTWGSYIASMPVPSMPSIPAIPAIPSLRGKKAEAGEQAKDDEAKEQESALEQARNYAAGLTGKKPDQETTDEAVESKPEIEKDASSVLDESKAELKTEEAEKDKSPEGTRTWASYIPAMPTIGKGSKGKEAETPTPAQSAQATEENEREVSVLLDRLNLSAINNRVFSFSQESQKLYQQFTLILKDMVNGVPTAYDDLEKLIRQNERQLEQMFANMPPFVQTLVKSLPAKFATSLGPEFMAAAADKPGYDLKTKMEAATSSSASTTSSGLNIPGFNTKKKQQKRNVPGIKTLAKQKGAVASMLSNILNFLKLRFPAFVTGTNVLMSLAVFILLFVFWYSHKRGRETRLLREGEEESARTSAAVSDMSSESESEDEKEGFNNDEKEKIDTEQTATDTTTTETEEFTTTGDKTDTSANGDSTTQAQTKLEPIELTEPKDDGEIKHRGS